MALLKHVSAIALALACCGCVGTAVNKAEVYKPVSGVLEMVISVPQGEALQKVQFQIDNELVHEDTDPSDGFSASVDVTAYESGKLYKLSAVGVRADGSLVVIRENYILVQATGKPGGVILTPN